MLEKLHEGSQAVVYEVHVSVQLPESQQHVEVGVERDDELQERSEPEGVEVGGDVGGPVRQPFLERFGSGE